MKPQKFEIGQAVTPKVEREGRVGEGAFDTKVGEIYTVVNYKWMYNEWYIDLQEDGTSWHLEITFEAVITDSELARELESIEVLQTAEV